MTIADQHARRWWLLGFVLLGQLSIVASLGSINLALPVIRDELGAKATELQWIVVIEHLAYAVLLIVGGRLGDVFGRRRMYVVGLAGFTLASLIAATAPTAAIVVLARLVQGAAGGFGSPQVLAMVHTVFTEPAERARAFAGFAMVSGVGFMAGQLGSGLLMELDVFGLGWRLPFLMSAVGTMVALVGAVALFSDTKPVSDQYVDLPSCALGAVASVLFLYPIIQGREAGWPLSYAALVALALVFAVGFVRRQRRLSPLGRSLVDITLFKLPQYRAGLLVAVMFSFSAFAPFFVIAYVLQSGFGLGPMETAVYTAGGPGFMIPATMLARRAARRFGRGVFAVGASFSALSTVAVYIVLNRADVESDLVWLLPAIGLQGFGQGLFLPSMTSLTMATVPEQRASAGSSVFQTVQQFAGATGMAAYSALFFGALGASTSMEGHVDAFGHIMPVMLLTAIGLVLASRRIPASALARTPDVLDSPPGPMAVRAESTA